MSTMYAYKYVKIRTTDGLCFGNADTSEYILDPMYVPVEEILPNFALKYYYPIPEEVNSFADFQGLFYHDAAHTQPFDEGNAVLRHED